MSSNPTLRPTALRRVAAVSLAALAAVAAGTLGAISAASPAGAAIQDEFLATAPGTYTWTVPAGVTTARFDLAGGAGGDVSGAGGQPGGGGLGGYVSGVLRVSAGDTYTLVVGGAGAHGGGRSSPGGFNGGGRGGIGGYQFPADGGGGGGGATDVRFGGDDFGSRIMVAGGGGGASSLAVQGGAGGGLVGGSGTVDTPVAGGGTQTAGGVRGGDPNSAHDAGSSGDFGVGGNGGLINIFMGGGGGGGGWNGGGGAEGGNGAGGSSLVPPQARNVANYPGVQAGDGYLRIAYGTPDPVSFVATTPPAGAVGYGYSYVFQADGWPLPEYSLVGSAPDGLSLDGRTGVLYGTPTTAGSFSVKIVADNGDSVSVAPVTITISGPPTFLAASTPTAGVGEAYSTRFATTGYPTPTVTTASILPAGLTLAPDGTLRGTPTVAGTYPVSLRADNGSGTVASYDVTLTVRAVPSLSIVATQATEPTAGTNSMTFPVQLSRASTVPVSVHWATKNGTALAGSDYVAASGTLTFSPGATTASVTVVVKADKVNEAKETLKVNLTQPSHAKIGTGTATGTITKPVNP